MTKRRIKPPVQNAQHIGQPTDLIVHPIEHIDEMEDDVIRPLALRPVYMKPAYMAHPPGWLEHIPFAFWLMDAHRPGCFVELGVHTGNSYFAFCQAVEREQLDTRCYAVDHWQGDEHAGFYGETVFQKVQQHNNANYASFSQLIKSKFDDAIQYFPDGSIDLLHIDGLHTYEAVKRDFENWLPKLSGRAVVLFHDSNVRERNFGVFRLVQELQAKYPHFEFHHGHGLAVFGVGGQQTSALEALFRAGAAGDTAQPVREAFSRLGRACADSFLARERSERVASLQQVASQSASAFETMKKELSEAQKAVAARTREMEEARLTLRLQTDGLVKERDQAREQLQHITQAHDQLAAELMQARTIAARQEALAQQAEKHNADLQTDLLAIRQTLTGQAEALNAYKTIADRLEVLEAAQREAVSRAVAMTAERDTLAAQHQALTLEAAQSGQALTQLRALHAALESECQGTAAQLTAMTAERDTLAAQHQALTLEAAQSGQALTQLRALHAALESECQGMAAQLTAMTAERDTLAAQHQALTLEMVQCRQELAEQKALLTANAAEREAILTDLAGVRDDLADRNARLEEEVRQHRECRMALENLRSTWATAEADLRAQLAGRDADIAGKGEEIHALRAALEAAALRQADLAALVEGQERQSEAATARHAADMEALGHDLAVAREQIGQAEGTRRELEKTLRQFQLTASQEKSAAQREINQLKALLESQKVGQQARFDEIAALTQMLSEAEQTIEGLRQHAGEQQGKLQQAQQDAAKAEAHLKQVQQDAARTVAQMTQEARGRQGLIAELQQKLDEQGQRMTRLSTESEERERLLRADFAERSGVLEQERHRFEALYHAMRQMSVTVVNGFVAALISSRPLPDQQLAAFIHQVVGFDQEWYLKANPDVAEAGVDAFAHYLHNGITESRAPNSKVAGHFG